jgi:hypothetical protein
LSPSRYGMFSDMCGHNSMVRIYAVLHLKYLHQPSECCEVEPSSTPLILLKNIDSIMSIAIMSFYLAI